MSGGALARSLEAGLCLVTPGPADWESQGRPRSPDHTEHRGLVDVKGKGRLDTDWLLGKEGGVGKWSDTEWSEYSSEEGPAYMKDISEMPVKQ